jgi:hypothetical protein
VTTPTLPLFAAEADREMVPIAETNEPEVRLGADQTRTTVVAAATKHSSSWIKVSKGALRNHLLI